MAVYKLTASICDASTYATVVDVGDFLVPIIEDNGIVDTTVIPVTPHDYQALFVNPENELGGSYARFTVEEDVNIQSISRFYPLLKVLNLTSYSAYFTAAYRLKLSYAGSNDFIISQTLNVATTSYLWLELRSPTSRLAYCYFGQNNVNNHSPHPNWMVYQIFVKKGTLLYRVNYVEDGRSTTPSTFHLDVTALTQSYSTKILTYLSGAPIYVPDEDPNDKGGTSGHGGGNGNFDNTSDPVDFPSLPLLTASSCGMVKLFTPTVSQLNSLATEMWSPTIAQTLRNFVGNVTDVIIGLSIVPVLVPVSGSEIVKLGFVTTTTSMNVASSQFVTVDCGSINVSEYWGNFLDYSPQTKISLYLPFIGMVNLSTDDLMGLTVSVKYLIDLFTGACVACVKCGNHVLYQYSGSVAMNIPLFSRDFSQLAGTIATVAVTAASAGAGAATTAAGKAGATAASIEAAKTGAVSRSIAQGAVNGVTGGALKPSVTRSGSVSGSHGLLSIRTPYLVIERPRQCLPVDYRKFVGYPSYITDTIGNVTGYTEIDSVHLENIPATDEELNEIETLLSAGVIL